MATGQDRHRTGIQTQIQRPPFFKPHMKISFTLQHPCKITHFPYFTHKKTEAYVRLLIQAPKASEWQDLGLNPSLIGFKAWIRFPLSHCLP